MDLHTLRVGIAACTALLGWACLAVHAGTRRLSRYWIAALLTAALAYRTAPYVVEGAPREMRGFVSSICTCCVVIIVYTSLLLQSGVMSALRAIWLGVLVTSSIGDGLFVHDLNLLPGQNVSDLGFAALAAVALTIVCMRVNVVRRDGSRTLRGRVASGVLVVLTVAVILTHVDDMLPERYGDMLVAGSFHMATLAFALLAHAAPCLWRGGRQGREPEGGGEGGGGETTDAASCDRA